MTSKVVSFQVVQGYASAKETCWSPDIIALCEDGSLWALPLSHYQSGYLNWTRITPELPKPSFEREYPNTPF